ncbi:CBS domain-containing protein [Dehalobacterium formicoaceticum]|uniref:CBS domain-containing protein n=1 Tax=Dehalobacterium formicoaceticum TaxID=51515 RepID=A0ABT1Y1M1_9FIRM|nr:CBS domain-containing protein [Dehalobacterium formicoaceticum]MCR6544758.1 CBS domain-containing protein [Dehalobacterium formicoaceticum]
MQAKDIMSKNVVAIKKDTKIEDIATILIENHISGVPVVDDDNHLIGIVTEGDLLHQETAPRLPGVFSLLGGFIYYNGLDRYRDDFKKLSATIAEEIMTKDVLTIREDMDVADIASIFVNKNVNRVPVLRNKKLIGIVSRADILKTFLPRGEKEE